MDQLLQPPEKEKAFHLDSNSAPSATVIVTIAHNILYHAVTLQHDQAASIIEWQSFGVAHALQSFKD